MESKESFRLLVENVAFQKKTTQEQLAVQLGYGKTYISEMLAPTGKLSKKFIDAFKREYANYLENPKNNSGKQALALGGLTVTLQDHFDLMKEKDQLHSEHKATLKEYASIMKRIIEARLLVPKSNSVVSKAPSGSIQELTDEHTFDADLDIDISKSAHRAGLRGKKNRRGKKED